MALSNIKWAVWSLIWIITLTLTLTLTLVIGNLTQVTIGYVEVHPSEQPCGCAVSYLSHRRGFSAFGCGCWHTQSRGGDGIQPIPARPAALAQLTQGRNISSPCGSIAPADVT